MDVDNKLLGFYRAKVVNNKDPEKKGRVIVWIPQIMPEVPETEGIWARPANNPVGGRNMDGSSDNHFMGTCYIPRNGSWIFVFFEAGDIKQVFYFGALDLGNTPVLPECQEGNYDQKWVIFRSPQGRCIVISDDENDARIEITGKKRQITDPPTGDVPSVYNIDGNQTTIMFDEVEGREKILIRTHLGDFIHIDIDQQKLQCFFKGDILFESEGSIHIQAAKDIKVKADSNIYYESGNVMHLKSGAAMFQQSGADHHTKAAGSVLRDGADISDQGGGAADAVEANPDLPVGERNT